VLFQVQGLERSCFANKTGALSRAVSADIICGWEEEGRGEVKVEVEITRCWGTPGCSPREQLVGVVATRARWRVVSKEEGEVMSMSRDSDSVIDGDGENRESDEVIRGSSKSLREECEGAGEIGRVMGAGSGLDAGVSELVDGVETVPLGFATRDVIPCAARALMTASQPCSSVLMRSLSSWFSRSFSESSQERSHRKRLDNGEGKMQNLPSERAGAAGAPALRRAFSSSKSCTRSSRWEN
jgi:hypothetical protein